MTTSDAEIVEGELVPYEQPASVTLFGTSDPRVALERMSDLAKVLVDLVRAQGLAVRIRGAEHLRVEAWRALGSLVGVHAVTAWSKLNETGDGYLVRVEARTRAGEVVGASEAECSRAESTWARRDAHALRAMAETRATSRALRGPLGQIVVMSGYQPAAVEEIHSPTPEPKAAPTPIPDSVKPTGEQLNEIKTLLGTLDTLDPGTDWRARCVEIVGAPWSHTTQTMAARLTERLQADLAELTGSESGEAA
jgi:hypothetical protein